MERWRLAVWVALVASAVLFVAPATGAPLLWAGNVTDTSVSFRVTEQEGNTFQMGLRQDFAGPLVHSSVLPSARASIHVSGLAPHTRYFYRVVDQPNQNGTFKTFHSAGVAGNFTVAFASCGKSHSNAQTYVDIRESNPDFFIHMGDLHYENIAMNDVERFYEAYAMVFDSPNQRDLYKSTAMVYTYDDHDFGANNADGSSPSKPAVERAYRESFPHYPLPATTAENTGAVYQAFTNGRVRFVVMDLRAEQVPNQALMSETQFSWLTNELSAWSNYSLVVLVSGQPWIGPEEAGATNWMGWPAYRARLADFIASQGITNLIMLSGDAHMVAVDDGSNSDYRNVTRFPSTGAGFPVFQSAAMDRPGSSKGGPYSEGCYGYSFGITQQWSTMDVIDNATTVCIHLRSYRVGQEEPLVEFEACGATVRLGQPGAGTCEIQVMPDMTAIMIGVAYGVGLCLILISFLYMPARKMREKEPIHQLHLATTLLFILATVPIIPGIAFLVNLEVPLEAIFPTLVAQLCLDFVYLIAIVIIGCVFQRQVLHA